MKNKTCTLSKGAKEKDTEYTIILCVKSTVGVLEKTLNFFSEKSLFISSINSYYYPEKFTCKIVVVVSTNYKILTSIFQLIKNDIELININFYTEEELIYFEIAQYKIAYSLFINNDNIKNLVDAYQANIVEANSRFVLIEKKGITEEIMSFYYEISLYGLLSFNRSGKIIMMNN